MFICLRADDLPNMWVHVLHPLCRELLANIGDVIAQFLPRLPVISLSVLIHIVLLCLLTQLTSALVVAVPSGRSVSH